MKRAKISKAELMRLSKEVASARNWENSMFNVRGLDGATKREERGSTTVEVRWDVLQFLIGYAWAHIIK